MRIHRYLGAGLVAAFALSCTDTPQPTGPSGDFLLSRGGDACTITDDASAKVRTVSGSCTNAGVSVPDGWTLKVEGGIATAAADMTFTPLFTAIPNPDAAYIAATTLIDISSIADFTNLTSITDGTQTATFSITMQKRSVPASWVTWGSPPFTEGAFPHILFTQGSSTLTIDLSVPSEIVGFELNPNPFELHTYTADFFAGATLVGSITRDIHGDAGARLLAADGDGQAITRVEVTGSADFAIANVRYAPATVQPPIDVDLHDVYSGLPRQAPGVISLEDDWVFVEILDVEQYLPRSATPDQVRFGPSFETGTPAESFLILDIDSDGNRDIRVRWSRQVLVDDGHLTCETRRVQVWGEDEHGQQYRGDHEVEVIDCPGEPAVCFDNGGFVTHPGAGVGGADVSMAEVIGGISTAGSAVRLAPPTGPHFRIADDFTITESCIVSRVITHGYETGQATPTWTGANLNIRSGSAVGPIVASATTTSWEWTGVYRTFNGVLINADRPVHAIIFDLPNVNLAPGTYWIDFQVEGGLSGWANYRMEPNPANPGNPITVFGNGQQMFNSLGAWQPTLQAPGAEVPFVVIGTGPAATVAYPVRAAVSPMQTLRATRLPRGHGAQAVDAMRH